MTPPQTIASVPLPGRTVDSVLASRWARVLLPSLSDLFFLAILAWLFAAGSSGWQGLLADGDAGWHIRTGQYILDHLAVPHQDLYSFSKPGAPWYAWEWGSDVLFGALHRLAGLKGVVLPAAVLIAVFSTTLLRRMIWRGTHCFAAVIIALLGVGGASMHYLARPHVFTLLLLSLSVWMIEADRARPSRRIWLLVPVTIVWTNLHGGFLALIAVLGLACAGSAVESWMSAGFRKGPQWNNALRYGSLACACMASSLVNPYGYRLHQHMFEYLRSDWIKSVIQEFQSPSFRSENVMQFEALMLVGLIVAGALLRQRRVVEGLWIVFFAHMALTSVRHVPIYITVVAPVIAQQLGEWWQKWSFGASKGSPAGILNALAADSASGFARTSIWPAAGVAALCLIGSPIAWPKDFPDLLFPTAIVHKHGSEILNARVLTTDQWADYLIYTNPSQKVYVDGRSDFYGPAVGNEYIRLTNGQWDWQQILDKYNFNLALLPTDLAIVQLLKSRPDWRVEEDDGKRILLVRQPTSVPLTGVSPPEQRF